MKKIFLSSIVALAVLGIQANCETKTNRSHILVGSERGSVFVLQGITDAKILSNPLNSISEGDDTNPVFIKITGNVPLRGLYSNKKMNCLALGTSKQSKDGKLTNIRLEELTCNFEDNDEELIGEGKVKGWIVDKKTKKLDSNFSTESVVEVMFKGGDEIKIHKK